MKFKINSDPETAFSYLRWTVKSLEWYRQNGYPTDKLPAGDLLEEMKQSVLAGDDKSVFYQKFYERATRELYDEGFFKKMHTLIDSKLPYVEQICSRFSELKKNWGFKTLDTYCLDLTYGGPGGAYDAWDGKVILKMPKSYEFEKVVLKKWEWTIIHEMLHIGIEENIVQAFQLSQNEKERVVDLMTRYFTGGSSLQERGDKSMDAFVTDEAIVGNLVEAVGNAKASLKQIGMNLKFQQKRDNSHS